ncbi:MAG: hypothetical protein WBG96_01875 [Thermoanaerobaculia bacterium]
MTPERKVRWIVVGAVVAVMAFLLLSERVEKTLAPEPQRAWIAIEVAGTGMAKTGHLHIESGTPFTLHAVLEARTLGGGTIYFTEASRLEIRGEEVPTEALRRWTSSEEVRILWFTVEGFSPYFEVSDASDLESFEFREFYRPEWPRTWSVPGELQPFAEKYDPQAPKAKLPGFGTQRYHLRLEFFEPASEITPRLRLQSPGAASLPDDDADLPTVVVSLADTLAAPSRVFGLTQIKILAPDLTSVADWLTSWSARQLAFSRLTVIKEMLSAAGITYEALDWQEVDLESGPGWGGEGVAAGDFLRVGDRLVVLAKDLGTPSVLDYQDLCFDYLKGAKVQLLREVFAGEGLVEWAALPRG